MPLLDDEVLENNNGDDASQSKIPFCLVEDVPRGGNLPGLPIATQRRTSESFKNTDTTSTGKMRNEQLATIEIALVLNRQGLLSTDKNQSVTVCNHMDLTELPSHSRRTCLNRYFERQPRVRVADQNETKTIGDIKNYSSNDKDSAPEAEKLHPRRWIPSAGQSPVIARNTTLEDILTSNGATIKIQMDLHTDAWRLFHCFLVSPRRHSKHDG
ncbi:hypothetical protein PISMIDRAFT_658237 [Pisolithus microcarpus 441]|uniref:Unplaced genomic scaffold scaffold_9, whole genome shotgun sequence n=1 Tax=Pisolithus microcarpus 441 TaxID=765257 RepID=A0A0C9ZQ01_9AGAM|nr:hypothetical protein PISMIDRAFT_658237 [Pisolithus microcarpus 441]